MIPPNQMAQQAMLAQRAMAMQRQNSPDALMQALSKQAAMGEAMKETAQYKMKMMKLKMKYGGQQNPAQGGVQQTQPPMGAGYPPQGPGGQPTGGI